MPTGKSEIPELRLEVLNGLLKKFMGPPNLMLTNLFPDGEKQLSDTVIWEEMSGRREMTPFATPSAPAPVTEPLGVGRRQATAAYIKEKMGFDEVWMNNIRKPGTTQAYANAASRMSDELMRLKYRALRRHEWMRAKILTDGGFTYKSPSALSLSIDYGIPAEQKITLAANLQWDDGVDKDIMGDIMTAKKFIKDNGGILDLAIFSSTVLGHMAMDTTIQAYLSKSTFGMGDLFQNAGTNVVGVNPNVLGKFLNIPNFYVYDEVYEARAYLTAPVTAASTTTVYLDDVSDFASGGTATFLNTRTKNTEKKTISAVDYDLGTITITAPTYSYRAGLDLVAATMPIIPEDKIIFCSTKIDGQPIIRYLPCPHGLNREYGLKSDSHVQWDPDVAWIRVKDSGLPVVYYPDQIVVMDVI